MYFHSFGLAGLGYFWHERLIAERCFESFHISYKVSLCGVTGSYFGNVSYLMIIKLNVSFKIERCFSQCAIRYSWRCGLHLYRSNFRIVLQFQLRIARFPTVPAMHVHLHSKWILHSSRVMCTLYRWRIFALMGPLICQLCH